MLRFLLVFAALTLPLVAMENDGPLISITSPDKGETFALATTKSRAMVWNKRTRMLSAVITFTDAQNNFEQPNDDTHTFRLPGVTLDDAHGVFFATSPKGDLVPVARLKKTLFLSTIQILPNAVVRILHERSNVTVILEAIRPDDPAMHAPEPATEDGTHSVDLRQLVQ